MNLVVCPELPTASVVRRKRRPPPWTTLHRSRPARSPLINRGKLFKQTGPLLNPAVRPTQPSTRRSRRRLRVPACASTGGGRRMSALAPIISNPITNASGRPSICAASRAPRYPANTAPAQTGQISRHSRLPRRANNQVPTLPMNRKLASAVATAWCTESPTGLTSTGIRRTPPTPEVPINTPTASATAASKTAEPVSKLNPCRVRSATWLEP